MERGAKERTDRVLLTPWVKFLWESYRNMLELLKNNYTVERIYADVAKDGEGEIEGRGDGGGGGGGCSDVCVCE